MPSSTMRGAVGFAAAIAVSLAVAGSALADAPQVVATIKPLHSLTAAVMQGVGEPYLLVRGAASPHSYALRPSDSRALDRAALVVWVGPGLETFLEKPLKSLAGDATALALAEAPGIVVLPTRDAGAWNPPQEDDHDHKAGHRHDHGHDHGHDHADDHGHAHGHDHGHDQGHGPDPHVWLDPRNARAIVTAVTDALVRIDPARAATYRANAAAVNDRLAALDAELEQDLAPVRHRPFIVFHDAYRYLESRYGLRAAGTITVSPDQRPGAARLRDLRETVRRMGAVCVFGEPQFEPALVRTIAEGTDIRTGMLDPEGAMLDPGPDLYFTLMRANAKALTGCLSAG